MKPTGIVYLRGCGNFYVSVQSVWFSKWKAHNWSLVEVCIDCIFNPVCVVIIFVCTSPWYYWKIVLNLTFLFLRWMSPMELARLLGPRRVLVLWGQSTLTRLCSPISTFRTFSAPVTRITGRPSKWVLNTLPYFCLLEAWNPAPYIKEGKRMVTNNSVGWIDSALYEAFNSRSWNLKSLVYGGS